MIILTNTSERIITGTGTGQPPQSHPSQDEQQELQQVPRSQQSFVCIKFAKGKLGTVRIAGEIVEIIADFKSLLDDAS